MGKIYVIMGKSATGKDTIYQEVYHRLEEQLATIVTYTTRPIRDREMEGREYHFVTEAEYEKLHNSQKVIEERAYHTVYGIWRYFMVNDGQIDLNEKNYIMVGTLEAYQQIRAYYGEEHVVPLYIEVENGTRLTRALEREKMQSNPKYVEMCRRFIADEEDFCEEKVEEAGILKRYQNRALEQCVEEITEDILADLAKSEMKK